MSGQLAVVSIDPSGHRARAKSARVILERAIEETAFEARRLAESLEGVTMPSWVAEVVEKLEQRIHNWDVAAEEFEGICEEGQSNG